MGWFKRKRKKTTAKITVGVEVKRCDQCEYRIRCEDCIGGKLQKSQNEIIQGGKNNELSEM